MNCLILKEYRNLLKLEHGRSFNQPPSFYKDLYKKNLNFNLSEKSKIFLRKIINER